MSKTEHLIRFFCALGGLVLYGFAVHAYAPSLGVPSADLMAFTAMAYPIGGMFLAVLYAIWEATR